MYTSVHFQKTKSDQFIPQTNLAANNEYNKRQLKKKNIFYWKNCKAYNETKQHLYFMYY